MACVNASSPSDQNRSNSRSELEQPHNILSRLWHTTSQEFKHVFIHKQEQCATPSMASWSFEALKAEVDAENLEPSYGDATLTWVLDQQWPVSDPKALLDEYFNKPKPSLLEKAKRTLKPAKRQHFSDGYEEFEKTNRFGKLRDATRKVVEKSAPKALLHKLKKTEWVLVAPSDSISVRDCDCAYCPRQRFGGDGQIRNRAFG